jgi:hypothetical protein
MGEQFMIAIMTVEATRRPRRDHEPAQQKAPPGGAGRGVLAVERAYQPRLA